MPQHECLAMLKTCHRVALTCMLKVLKKAVPSAG